MHLAAGAGALIREVAGPHCAAPTAAALGLVAKEDATPQTVADRNAQRHIISGLRAHAAFARLAIVGEEGGEEADAQWAGAPIADLTLLDGVWTGADALVPVEDVVCWIDPLDGTKEFTQGRYRFVTVLIGITVRGRPALGVIGEPYAEHGNGRILWGGPAVGSVFEFKPADGTHTPLPPPADEEAARTSAVCSLSRSAGAVSEALSQLEAQGLVRARIPAGGAGYKAACVIDGRAAFWLFPPAGTSRWDTCAPQALIEAVGGALVDGFGARIEYDAACRSYNNRRGVVACRDRTMVDAVVQITRTFSDASR